MIKEVVTKLSRSALIRTLVRLVRLHRVGNAWLKRFPLRSQLPISGVIYRASRLESIPLAAEMLVQNKLYDSELLPRDFTTFADLGCNVGYFACWLKHIATPRMLKGIMLDANPDAVSEAQWHASANGMSEVFAIHGIVGQGKPGTSAEFYLYESNICSTSHLPDVEKMALKGKWTQISVPCVSVEENWRRHFVETRCNVLKIDVEGSELDFLREEDGFLKRCDSVLIEWHKWTVQLDELKSLLADRQLQYVKTIEENSQMGTAFFIRS